MDALTAARWPTGRLGEAIEALARRRRLGIRAAGAEGPPPPPHEDRLGPWIEAAAAALGLEAEPVEVPYAEVDRLVRGARFALLRLPEAAGSGFLAVLGGRGRRITLLGPDLGTTRARPEELRAAVCAGVEAPVAGEVERLLAGAGLRGRRRERARRALRGELLGARRIGGCWLLRPGDAEGEMALACQDRLPARLLGFLGIHAAGYALWLLSWWLLGRMALTGRFDPGWLLAWALLLLSLIPFRLLTTALGGRLALGAGALLRCRLLIGALKLEPDEVHHLGVGGLLGRVLESEVVESMALAGGLLGLTAAVELAMAAVVLGVGAGGRTHAALLLVATAAALGLGLRDYRRRRGWAGRRLDLTDALVERMVDHRTRLAQEPRRLWNEGEDRDLERYLVASADLDRVGVALQAAVPRGWLVVGLLGLAPALVTGGGSAGGLALGLGGVLLAHRALRGLAEGLERIAAAAIAWERVGPFWRAAMRREPVGSPRLAAARPSPGPGADRGRILLDVRDLVFRYPDRAAPVLAGVDLAVRAGDRLLLEGPSGGGKSTLAALLTGGRAPDAGLLLLDGLDRATLGADGWRRRVALAPQFHENRVLMGTFAFNALMGRAWPPRPADLAEAERVALALGLGPLLARMPAGLDQMVGETGWQLSHGERSRLYLARALLQGAELVVLDESFAALDPETLRRTLGFVLAEAPTALVIAHP
jgi:ATP-binding cassette subfamily B protein